MARGKRKRRRRERPEANKLLDRPAARPAVLKAREPVPDPYQLQSQANAVNLMLIECPTYGVEIREGGLWSSAYRPVPGVCKSCGLTPGYVELHGCPRMRSIETILGSMMGNEELFEDRGGIIVPGL